LEINKQVRLTFSASLRWVIP